MLVHRKKKARMTVQMPLTSLIDIVFLLLIYFLLTTNFITDQGIDIKLPDAKAAKPQTQQEITVAVDAGGRVYLKETQVSLSELAEALRSMISGSEERLVIVKADRAVILDKAVAVMDVAKAAGASRLCLATERE